MFPEMNLKKTKTQRYVYHLSYKYNRASILKKGLRGRDQHPNLAEPVFAHNKPIPDLIWFPFILDSWEWKQKNKYKLIANSNYDFMKIESLIKGYDVWEIDTFKINNMTWYKDPWSMKDFLNDVNYSYYVVTEGWIPPSVLKLYTFHEEHYFEKGDGVAHIGPDFRPVSNKTLESYKNRNAA